MSGLVNKLGFPILQKGIVINFCVVIAGCWMKWVMKWSVQSQSWMPL
jgi:hypothetical protein